jgi:hypothetical protein
MADYLFIIPGYSDEDFSFLPLRNLLIQQGLYEEHNIRSIEYASLNDQADFRDFADKLDEIYERDFADTRIDVLAHSTGSLVVRAWLYLRRMRQRIRNQRLDVPVEHLFLFAPANFGSDLAKLGQSPLNALKVTFTKLNRNATLIGNQNAFETGRKVLQGLEPASPIQWQLSMSDLHQETYFGKHDETGLTCFPFVFAAGNNFKNLESVIVKELQKDGTDSTVRIAGTSLNTRKFKLRSRRLNILSPLEYQIEWDDELLSDVQKQKLGDNLTSDHPRRKFENIAFAIFGTYDHCGIINDNGKCKKPKNIDEDAWTVEKPQLPDNWEPLELLKAAKQITTAEKYQALSEEFTKKTDAYSSSRNTLFQQFFFKVIDDTGLEIDDYFIRFFVYDLNDDLDLPNENLSKEFRASFGDGVDFYIHSCNASYRSLMINIKGVLSYIENNLQTNKQIKMQVITKSPFNGVSFPSADFIIYDSKDTNSTSFFFPHTTTLVEIVLDRRVDDIILGRGTFSIGSGLMN